ncbi:integral membrane protein [Penicillium digitatum]|uniref:Integral membrane protein n=1 Tax=Penicillium digitatum TaxID=36651 RepID=A0A7T6XK11_PENDI|nr:integral membrane protein [Penicillium digitatum]
MVALSGDRKTVLEAIWALGGVAIIVVVLRVFAKARLRHFGLDDLIMIVSLSFALAASISLTIAVVDYGFASGRPGVDEATAIMYYTIEEVCSVTSTCLGRVAFILYLLPVLSTRKVFKISLWVLFALQITANSVMVILILSQCHDIRGVWDPKYATNCTEDYIQLRFGYFLCFCNSSADLLLAVFPCYIFWDLKLKPMIKFSLMVLTSLGVVATIGAIMKAVYLQEILTWDGTANAIKLTCWAMIECYLVIITASVPCLRSLVVSSVRQMFASDKSTTFPFTSSYRKKTATHQRMTNFEASGSRQNIFSGARGEDIEMGTTRASVNANGSEDGREGAPDGIGKTVDISITWEQGHGRDRTP